MRILITAFYDVFEIFKGVGDRGSEPPPLNFTKPHGSLNPDPLDNHKATKPAFNVWPSSARLHYAVHENYRKVQHFARP